MIPHDYHMHSNFSCDCKATMAEMCRSAIAKGIPEIGFSEHYDLHPGEYCRDWFRADSWWAELEQCRAQFAGQLTIRAGIEIGEPHLFRAEAEAMLARFPFDYVLGSLHWVGRASIFDLGYFQQRGPEDAYRDFFEELERMTAAGGFDSLSHFDVPVRVGYEVHGAYDPRRFEAAIRPVLRNLIEHGIALDLNTAALRRRARVLTPGLEILSWYVEMGGERVTLGSDAHRPENIGQDLDVAMDIARQAGVRHVTQFEARQPRLVPLPVLI